MKKIIIISTVLVVIGAAVSAVLLRDDETASFAQTLEDTAITLEERQMATSSGEAEATEEAPEAAPAEPVVIEDVLYAEGTERMAEVEEPTPQNSVLLGEVPEGNIITVAEATLVKPGFVALYRINSNGDSALVGNSDLLSAGAHHMISIQLRNLAVKRQAMVAVLHEDDGDGKFEFPESDPYLKNGPLLSNDIDVVGVSRTDREARILETQVEAYLETNFKERD